MNQKVLLSILIPVYNAEKFLRRCLDSIVRQSLFKDDVEIVIINDGSKDGSLSIIQSYNERFHNIRYFSRENKGIGPTRNELITNAHGTYFWFVDADDFVADNSLELLLPLLKTDEYDMLMMGYYWGTETSGRIIPCIGNFSSGLDMAAHDVYNNSLWTRVYRISIIREHDIRFNSYQMGEDFDVIFKLIPYIGKCKCINQPLYNYIANPHSAVSESSKKHIYRSSDDSLLCMEDNFTWLRQFDTDVQKVLKKPLIFFLMGYLFSIYVVPFTLRYKLDVMTKLEAMGAFPIHPLPVNKRQRIFSRIVNIKVFRILSIYIDVFVLWLKKR